MLPGRYLPMFMLWQGMNFVPAQAEAMHMSSAGGNHSKAGDMVTSKERITITPPYGAGIFL